MKLFEFVANHNQFYFIIAEAYDVALDILQENIDDGVIDIKSVNEITEWFQLDIDEAGLVEAIQI